VDELIERLHKLAEWPFDYSPAIISSLAKKAATTLEATRVDAERWRHARRILTVEDIESAQDMFDAFGFEGDEHENRKADAAIDQARGKGGCGEGVA
jgi:hypothetical protein